MNLLKLAKCQTPGAGLQSPACLLSNVRCCQNQNIPIDLLLRAKKQSLVKGTANIDKIFTKVIAGKEKMSIFAIPFGKQFFNGSIAQLV